MNPADDLRRRRFLWGVVLAWLPFFLFVIPFVVQAFGEIAEQKATGVAALLASVSGGFFILGMAGAFALPLAAVVLLVRSFSTEHPRRVFLAVMSIGASAMVLLLAGVSLWLLYVFR